MFAPVWAESIQINVDKNYTDNNSDGSPEKPYTKIGKAIEACSQKCVINVRNGIYNENIVLKESMKIIGEDNKKTIITSLRSTIIKASGKNDIENITVLGGFNGVIFENGGSLKNSFVRDASRIGIILKENDSLVEILNSTLKNNCKGIYAEKGSRFNIFKNIVEANQEEGIDIREETEGKIIENFIIGNLESGIEIILGSSNVQIEKNIIEKNQSSGIALQFYAISREIGNVLVQENEMTRNEKNGIV